MAFCERLSEQLAVVGTIDPISQAAALISTDVVDMSLHRRCLFTLLLGLAPDAAGVLVEIQEGTVAVPNSAVILTSAGVDVDVASWCYIWEVSAEAMADTYTVLRGDFTPLGAGPTRMAVLVQADVERYHPGSDRNIAGTTIMGTAN